MSSLNNAPKSSINRIIKGYKKFKTKHFEQTGTYKNFAHEIQSPKVLAIACCDSRVDPAIVTSCNPGELFVIRNVANLVPPFNTDPRHHGTSAALEFGVIGLEVTDIIIFGHSNCGGIQALLNPENKKIGSDFISSWMNIAKPAKEKTLKLYPHHTIKEQRHYCEKESLLVSMNNLTTFPWIKERVLKNKLSTHTWYYNLLCGTIEAYQSSTNKFILLDELYKDYP